MDRPSATVNHKGWSIKLNYLEYPVNQNIKKTPKSRYPWVFLWTKQGARRPTEKRHQSPFQSRQSSAASLPHSATPQGEPFAFSLGRAVQHSGVVNGIKINDNLSPLGLELPAKTTKKHTHETGTHRHEDTNGKHQIKTWMRMKVTFSLTFQGTLSSVPPPPINVHKVRAGL